MPNPYRTLVCQVCNKTHRTRSATARTCSKKCGAIMRQEYAPNGRTPRDYPAELVERVRALYESGMSWVEVQDAIGPGCKVAVIRERYGIESREAKPRIPFARERHAAWKGDDAGYQALHLRVQKARGKPSLCEWCGKTDGKFEWANLTGQYTDVNDYERLCTGCHRSFDAARRAELGTPTTPASLLRRQEVMPHV